MHAIESLSHQVGANKTDSSVTSLVRHQCSSVCRFTIAHIHCIVLAIVHRRDPNLQQKHLSLIFRLDSTADAIVSGHI